MAYSLCSWLRGDEDVFVAVGAGHFAGQRGLPSLLRERGWAVTQIGE